MGLPQHLQSGCLSRQMKRILVYLALSQSLLLGTWESILYCSKPNSFHCHEEKSNLVQLYCNWIADSFLLRCKTFEAPPRMKTFFCSKDKIVKAPFKYSLRELANIWSWERESYHLCKFQVHKVRIFVGVSCHPMNKVLDNFALLRRIFIFLNS